jgi:hypothetical protein
MSDELHDDRVADLFARAKDLPADDQVRFLEEKCLGEPHDVRRRVEKLLAADRRLKLPPSLDSSENLLVAKPFGGNVEPNIDLALSSLDRSST